MGWRDAQRLVSLEAERIGMLGAARDSRSGASLERTDKASHRGSKCLGTGSHSALDRHGLDEGSHSGAACMEPGSRHVLVWSRQEGA